MGPQYERFGNAYREAIPYEKLSGKKHRYPRMPIELEDFLEEILNTYGEHSAWYLEQLVKKELPWRKARSYAKTP